MILGQFHRFSGSLHRRHGLAAQKVAAHSG
jgi:hypothetical protein